MFSLDERQASLESWCTNFIPERGYTLDTPISDIYTLTQPQLDAGYGSVTALNQCMTEQKYVRGSMSRAALYLQVSISGQALVFVVRTMAFSWISIAGMWTYIAFLGAQFCATLIAVFGFNGYTFPPNPIDDCEFCTLSSGGFNPFFAKREVPIYGTEAVYTASVIGCTYYVVAAWIWAAIWSFGLDPIKWMMHYILNEEGIRQQSFYETFFNKPPQAPQGLNARVSLRSSMSRMSMGRASVGRVSMAGAQCGGIPGHGAALNAPRSLVARASIVRVSATGPVHGK